MEDIYLFPIASFKREGYIPNTSQRCTTHYRCVKYDAARKGVRKHADSPQRPGVYQSTCVACRFSLLPTEKANMSVR